MDKGERFGLRAFWSDLVSETSRSFRETPRSAKFVLTVGFSGFVTFAFFPIALPVSWWSAALRIAFLCAFILGAIMNARYADEFYRRVYLNSCAIALPASAIFFYAAGLFRLELGTRAIGYLIIIWFLSFLAAFGALRRA